MDEYSHLSNLRLDSYGHSTTDGEARDFRDFKNVNQDGNADGVYWMQPSLNSTYTVFPAPGVESANSLRQFFRERLSSEFIRDEYGHIVPIAEIKDDCLPTLQKWLWRGLNGLDMGQLQLQLSNPEIQIHGALIRPQMDKRPPHSQQIVQSKAHVHLAKHIAHIDELLQLNHIFIVCDESKRSCTMSACQTLSDQKTLPSIITIEPLIHWATVSMATDISICHGKLKAFRRNGEKCQDPLWSEAVKKYTPKHSPAYCLDCLSMLMIRQTEAWSVIAKGNIGLFTSIRNLSANMRSMAGNLQLEYGFDRKDCAAFTDWSVIDVHQAPKSEDKQPFPLDQSNSQALTVSFNLDGTYDSLPTAKYVQSRVAQSTHSPNTQSSGKMSGELLLENLHEDSQYIDNTSKPPSITRFKAAVSSNLFPETTVRTKIDHPNIRMRSEVKKRKLEAIELHKYRIVSGIIDGQSKQNRRRFGHEQVSNAIVSSINKVKVGKGRQHILSSEQEDKASDTCTPYLPALNHPFEENQISNTASINLEVDVKTKEVSPPDNERFLKLLLTLCESKAKSKKKPPVIFTPFFAKRYPLFAKSVSETIGPETYLEYQLRAPASKEIICSCRQSANTETTQLAQCSNPNCAFDWFHYNCLDRGAKLSGRAGRLVCQNCRNEKFFADESERNGWSIERLVEQETNLAFTGQEMFAEIPAFSGQSGGANPYGLGTKLEVPKLKKSKGVLGSLAFLGYSESSPFLVCEAYLNPKSHLEVEDEFQPEDGDMYEDKYQYEGLVYHEDESDLEDDEGLEDERAFPHPCKESDDENESSSNEEQQPHHQDEISDGETIGTSSEMSSEDEETEEDAQSMEL